MSAHPSKCFVTVVTKAPLLCHHPLTFLETNVDDDKSTFSEKKEKEKKRKTGVECHGMIVVF